MSQEIPIRKMNRVLVSLPVPLQKEVLKYNKWPVNDENLKLINYVMLDLNWMKNLPDEVRIEALQVKLVPWWKVIGKPSFIGDSRKIVRLLEKGDVIFQRWCKLIKEKPEDVANSLSVLENLVIRIDMIRMSSIMRKMQNLNQRIQLSTKKVDDEIMMYA